MWSMLTQCVSQDDGDDEDDDDVSFVLDYMVS
jgi:hypothetical protein